MELSFPATGVVFVVMEVEISYTAESLTTKYTMKRWVLSFNMTIKSC